MLIRFLQTCELFANLSNSELELISPLFYEVLFKEETIIAQEGEEFTNLYLIKSGKVELTHSYHNHTAYDHLTCEFLSTGRVIGEQALLPDNTSPVTITTVEDTYVYGVNAERLLNVLKNNPTTHRKILENLGLNLSKHMETHANSTIAATKAHLKELETRIKFGIFAIYSLALIFIYNIAIEFVDEYINPHMPRTFATVTFLFCTAFIMVAMIKHMGYPFKEFGLNFTNWKKGIKEATCWSLLFIIGITVFKWWLITYIPKFQHIPLFDLTAITHIPHYSFETHNAAYWYVPAILYILFVPVQSFIVQGAFQSALMRFLVGPYAILISIVLANLLFASIHVDLQLIYAIAVIFPGLLWSILYTKQRSIVGISWSHMLIGFWSLWILGFDRLIGLAPSL